MLTSKGAADKRELGARFKTLNDWLETKAGPAAVEHFRHGADRDILDEWKSYDDESIFLNDPDRLQGFEISLHRVEADAADYGYPVPGAPGHQSIPGAPLHQGGTVSGTAGGDVAQGVSDVAQGVSDVAQQAAKDAADAADKKIKSVPWYVYAAGALGFGALGLGAGYLGLQVVKSVFPVPLRRDPRYY